MRFEVTISPQFDLCYALADVLSPAPHFAGWPGLKPDMRWLRQARSFGWSFWLGIPDLIEAEPPQPTIEAFLERLSLVPRDEVVPRLRTALLHSADADGKPSARKREWLHYIGLDDETAVSALARRSVEPLELPLAILRAFRRHFEPAWEAMEPQLEASACKVAKLAKRGSLPEVVSALALPLDVDDRRVAALRGGFKLQLREIGTLFLMPSPFNSRRLWNAATGKGRANLFLPYFLPEAVLPQGLRRRAPEGEAVVDPWLVARAIGDPSRAAILRLLARRPRCAADVQRELGLGKATISHHLFQLREAGLLTEQRSGRSVVLTVQLEPLRHLGSALERDLSSSTP